MLPALRGTLATDAARLRFSYVPILILFTMHLIKQDQREPDTKSSWRVHAVAHKDHHTPYPSTFSLWHKQLNRQQQVCSNHFSQRRVGLPISWRTAGNQHHHRPMICFPYFSRKPACS